MVSNGFYIAAIIMPNLLLLNAVSILKFVGILLEENYQTLVVILTSYGVHISILSFLSAPKYRLQEDIRGLQRIFFDLYDEDSSVLTDIFNIPSKNIESCQTFTAYVKVRSILFLYAYVNALLYLKMLFVE